MQHFRNVPFIFHLYLFPEQISLIFLPSFAAVFGTGGLKSGWNSTSSGHAPTYLFAFVTFGIGSCVFPWTSLDCDPPSCASLCSLDDTCMLSYPAISWDGVLLTFCLGWPQTVILLISDLCLLSTWDYMHEPSCLALLPYILSE
jgi:hypothetical protein